jgi:hypothetical protein
VHYLRRHAKTNQAYFDLLRHAVCGFEKVTGIYDLLPRLYRHGVLKKFHQGQATAGQLRKKAGFVLWLFPSLLERG